MSRPITGTVFLDEVGDIPLLEPIVEVAIHTGMRRGELLNLRWSNIDREKGFIRLQARETKEDKPRSIPLNRHVRAVLDTLPRPIHHDYVFTYRGEPIAYSLRRSLKTACKNVGQKDCAYEEFPDPAIAWKIAGLPQPSRHIIAQLKGLGGVS